MKVRTRFAPSPTGHLHIGGIRTALYCYAMAKKHGGQYILRIEDTDRKRFVEGTEEEILEMLDLYKIPADEDIKKGGNFGPYRQSDRLDIYQKYAEELVEKGAAYYCFMTKEELATARELAKGNKQNFAFRSKYRNMPLEEAREKIKNGEKYVIRQKMPDENKPVVYTDPLHGTTEFFTDEVDEGVLLKSDGFPTYHLAVVVDDHLMEISHVFRGVEWFVSTPKHLMLYGAFGWECPEIIHLSVILDPEGGKLSKRKGAVSARGFLEEGYLPDAILNFLMLLGWSSPEVREHGAKERELYSLQEFTELFDISGLNKTSPVFNREKLLWFNQKYMQAATPDALTNYFTLWLSKFSKDEEFKKLVSERGPQFLQSVLLLVQSRAKLLSEIPQSLAFFYNKPEAHKISEFKKLEKVSAEQIKTVIKNFAEELGKRKEDFSDFPHEEWEALVRKIADELKIKAGDAFMVLRVGLCGSEFSPPLYESMQILGAHEVLERINQYS